MKLKIYRITWLIFLSLVAILGLYFIVDSIILMLAHDGDNLEYFLNLLAMIVGLTFIGFNIVSIIKSFSQGTLVLKTFCFKDNGKINTWFFIVSIIMSLAGIAMIITFSINITMPKLTLIPNLNKSDSELFIFLGSICLVDFGYSIIYTLFLKNDDIFYHK